MKHIGQSIITFAVLAKSHYTILFGLNAYLDTVFCSGFRQIFDDYRMSRRFEGKLSACLLLSIHKHLKVLYTFHLQCGLGVCLALQGEAQEMKGRTIAHTWQHFAGERCALLQLIK